MTPVSRQMDMTARVDRLEAALARIIDDPLVVKILLFRDPEAWALAIEALGDTDAGHSDQAEQREPD
jgi:hypothetical protein